jgi:hypothetical protein
MGGYLDIIYMTHYPEISEEIKHEHLSIPGTGLTGRDKRTVEVIISNYFMGGVVYVRQAIQT